MAIMRISIAGKPRSSQAGFTYVMVLVAVVVLGIVLETADVQISFVQRREREAELLFRGQAYRTAIRYYYKAHSAYPMSLKDLLKDPHTINKHYLRVLYPDPITRGKKPWKLIRATNGGISGVASQSKDVPLKKANFPVDLQKFEKAKTYAEWEFVYEPKTPAKPPALPQSPPATAIPGKQTTVPGKQTSVPGKNTTVQSPVGQ